MNNVDLLSQFIITFSGLKKAYGVYRNGRGKTVRSQITNKQYEQHLNGSVGLGVVPINEQNECNFAVIDIDEDTIDHTYLASQIEAMEMPLLVCRSKSGGAHLYTFMDPPVPAVVARKALGLYASRLGYGSSEIFPKQDVINDGDIGNWINLPFFDCGNTIRGWWTSEGEKPLEEFIQAAQSLSSNNPIKGMTITDFVPEGMPPCLAYYFENGVPEGGRNEVLYNLAVFLRKSNPDNIEDQIHTLNYKIMNPPLTVREVTSVVKSIKRKDYQYKCKMPMFSERCNHVACKTMKFGVGGDFRAQYSDQVMGCLTKYLTDPPKWVMDVNGVNVEFNTDELMNYQRVRVLALERANVIIPPVKQEDWLILLKGKVETMKTVEAPDDATRLGDLASILADFIQIAERSTGGRTDLLRGIPVKDKLPAGEPVIYFRSNDFIAYLKRKKVVLNISGNDLWMNLRQCGCGHTRLKISEGKSIQTWYVYLEEDMITPRFSPMVDEIDI